MTGKAFIRLIAKRGIPLSCIANKLNCKLSTLRSLETYEKVPSHYLKRFKQYFQHNLTEQDLLLLAN
uniref:hypothetical protein n=1 Tax=Ningiella ruwaisensis TaxID=2364274 RepID=UPI0010A08486|nr:hypothetical protein [Ningiella ruwaisensis]